MSYVFKERNPPPEWGEFKSRAPHGSLVPFFFLSWLADWAAFCLGKWPMVELLEYLGSFSILFAAIFYFAGASDRTKQKHYQAWQVINTAQGKGGSGGRGGSGGIGSQNGSNGSDGSSGNDGRSGSQGRGGLITVTYDPQVKPYLSTIRLSSQNGPRPIYQEQTVAPLW